MIWVPSKFEFADPMTKRDSPIEKSLRDTFSSGALWLDMSETLVNDAKNQLDNLVYLGIV